MTEEKKSLEEIIKEFKKARYTIPTKEIEIEMHGQKVSWEIRMLTSEQLGIIHRSVEKARKLGDMINIVQDAADYDGKWDDTIEKLKAELGISHKTDPNLIRKYATFEQGSVACDNGWSRADTVKYAKFFSANFAVIYAGIESLFGIGPDVKKKQTNSGKDTTLKQT